MSVHEEYKDNFRMRKENFEKLCEDLRPLLSIRSTYMRDAVDVETQVAVTLCYLSHECPLRKQQTLSACLGHHTKLIPKLAQPRVDDRPSATARPLLQTDPGLHYQAIQYLFHLCLQHCTVYSYASSSHHIGSCMSKWEKMS